MRSIGRVRHSTLRRVLMAELSMVPAVHSAVRSVCSFWNKMVATPSYQLLKQAFMADLQTAIEYIQAKKPSHLFWATSVLQMVGGMDAQLYWKIVGWACRKELDINIKLDVDKIQQVWHDEWMDGWKVLPQAPSTSPSDEVKMCTYARWPPMGASYAGC